MIERESLRRLRIRWDSTNQRIESFQPVRPCLRSISTPRVLDHRKQAEILFLSPLASKPSCFPPYLDVFSRSGPPLDAASVASEHYQDITLATVEHAVPSHLAYKEDIPAFPLPNLIYTSNRIHDRTSSRSGLSSALSIVCISAAVGAAAMPA